MAKVTSATLCKVSSVGPGSLVMMRFGETAEYGLVISSEQRGSLIGILPVAAGSGDPPRAYEIPHSKDVVDLGSEWYLELLPDAHSVPGRSMYLEKGGYVHVTTEGPLITFQGDSKNYRAADAYYFNISKNELVDYPSNFAPVVRWRIWQSEDDLGKSLGRPIITFDGSGSSTE